MLYKHKILAADRKGQPLKFLFFARKNREVKYHISIKFERPTERAAAH